jgi:hypothetical protein
MDIDGAVVAPSVLLKGIVASAPRHFVEGGNFG